MSQRGRGAKATAAQRAEVVRLASTRMSVRGVAAAVFGDARYRDRVERILRPPLVAPAAESLAAELVPERVDLSGLEGVPLLRKLFERRLAFWAASEKAPSMSELRNMLEVQRRLEAFEMVERARQRQRAAPASE